MLPVNFLLQLYFGQLVVLSILLWVKNFVGDGVSLSHSMAVETPDGNRFGWRCAHVVWRMFDCAKPYVFSNFPKFLKPKGIQKRIGENGFIRLKGHPMICFSESAFFYSLGLCVYIYTYTYFLYMKSSKAAMLTQCCSWCCACLLYCWIKASGSRPVDPRS